MTAQEQIEELRAEYAKIEKMDPSSTIYDNLCLFLDALDTPKLQMLVDAKVKWVSMLANNRLIRRRMDIK